MGRGTHEHIDAAARSARYGADISLRLPGKEQDIRRIGAELNVENVLFTLAELRQLRVTERFGRPTVVPPYALPSGDLPGIMLTGRPPSKSERG